MIGLLQIEKIKIRAKILQSLNPLNPNSDIERIINQASSNQSNPKIVES